jgi:hypothetical protein
MPRLLALAAVAMMLCLAAGCGGTVPSIRQVPGFQNAGPSLPGCTVPISPTGTFNGGLLVDHVKAVERPTKSKAAQMVVQDLVEANDCIGGTSTNGHTISLDFVQGKTYEKVFGEAANYLRSTHDFSSVSALP